MALILFLILLALPVIEIIIFVQAGAQIGWVSVILLTILTAVLGTLLIRVQGFQALNSLRQSMAEGRPPVAPMVDGIFLLLAAPLMMTPGFVTDGLGFLLLVPPIRYFIARHALKRLKQASDKGNITIIRPQ
ncbi:MAG: FxsA family protein [Pseudomonadota bacterium]